MNSSNEEKNGANNGIKSEPSGPDSLKPGLPDIQTGDTLSLETLGSAYADTGIFRHVGKRESQQDAADCAVLKNGDGSDKNIAAAVLCDGMGGMNGGERASNLCVSTIMHELVQIKENTDINHLLKKCLQSLDSIVYNLKDDGGERLKAGTTIVCAVMRGEKLYWASVGDSRLYLMHGENIIQLTRDHNYLADLMVKVEKGLITEEEALNDKRREALTSYIGCGKLSLIDIGENPITMEYDDVLLLCSDGIYRGLNNYEVLNTVNFYNHDMVAAAKMLVEKTFEKDLPYQDNMTVVLMRYVNQMNTAQKPVMPPKAYIKYRANIPPVPKEDEMNAAFRAERAPKKKRRKLPSAALIAALIGAALVILTMLSLTVWRRPAEDTGTDADTTAKEEAEETEPVFTAENESDTAETTDSPEAESDTAEITESPETEPETAETTETPETVPDDPAVTGIKLDKSDIGLLTGGTDTVAVTFEPVNAADKITWTSNNEGVARVNAEGTVTAVSAGKTTITAETSNGKKAECIVTVTSPEKAVEVSAIAVSPSMMTLGTGQTLTLTATVSPVDAANKTVTWTSSNNGVATVAKGKVTAVAAGIAGITARTSNGKTATCTVTVKSNVVYAESVSLNTTTADDLSAGDDLNITATVYPSETTDKTVTWSSDNEAVATVDKGKVTAVSPGKAVITAKTSNGKTATFKVTVNPVLAETVKLNETSLSLKQGETAALTATVSPSNTTDKNITWTSDNKGVATVSDKGNITAISEGTATITAKTSNGKTATCMVEVKTQNIVVEKINIESNSITLNIGDTKTLKVKVLPDNAPNKTVSYSSDKTDVSTVNENGIITAISEGIATITVKASNGISSTCTVTVVKREIIKRGTCGSDVKWTLFINGDLVISGNGKMENYDLVNKAPWNQHLEEINSVTINNGVVSIGDWVFDGCNKPTKIKIPESIIAIGAYAFRNCSGLTEITIPNSVTEIFDYAFSGCYSLTNITIPNSVTNIGNGIFVGCKSLKRINVDSNNINYTNDENGVLYYKNKTKIIAYPAGNNSINLSIPNSVTEIFDYAFSGCYSLTEIKIPKSVINIGSYVFNDWTDTQTIYIEGISSAPSSWDNDWNKDCKAVIKWNQ